ncbi:MAG TPA: class II fructose-bisphosphate aldolase [Clostridiales bacterium]|nr:class II fructose-bisphosphate aldolase [Clostridiales bacterium]
MFTNIKHILDDAAQNYYGVIAGNAINMETAKGLITAAHEENAPLILIIGQGQMTRHANAELMVPMIKTLASKTPAPIALCLDHGTEFERIAHAFRHGFSSIMIDASAQTMEENIVRTKRVVELCHPQGVPVEGELGHVGMAAQGDGQDESLYTKPEDAVRFVRETGVDCLAIACGTAHGKYPEGYVPKINFDLIRAVKEATGGMPLALHGSSGSGDENIRLAVKAGINKINVATEILTACWNRLNELRSWETMTTMDPFVQMEDAAKEMARHWIRLAGSSGKADHFKPDYTFGDPVAKTYNLQGE